MHDEIAHRLELHIARDSADSLAFHFEVDKRRQEAAGLNMGFEFAVIERNHLGSLLVAINDTGNETFATYCAGGPLACPATLRGLKLNDLRHFYSPEVNEPRGSLPPGVSATAVVIGGV